MKGGGDVRRPQSRPSHGTPHSAAHVASELRQQQEREVAVGAVATAARLALFPVRVIARSPKLGSALAAAGREAEVGLNREVDGMLAGPVPDAVTRALSSGELDARVAASLREVISSPDVRAMLAGETRTYADELLGQVRAAAARLDERLDRSTAAGREIYGGLASRGAALVIDLALAQTALAVAGGTLALVTTLAGPIRPTWLAAAVIAAAWAVFVTTYFVLFWTTTGQTPGMRLLGLRVVREQGLGIGRCLLRLLGISLAIVPCFLGFAPALWDPRRRALPDYLAGTAVLRVLP
jgi:uncharacterized RDD family membrane protein YckC